MDSDDVLQVLHTPLQPRLQQRPIRRGRHLLLQEQSFSDEVLVPLD